MNYAKYALTIYLGVMIGRAAQDSNDMAITFAICLGIPAFLGYLAGKDSIEPDSGE